MSQWMVPEHFKVIIGGNTYIDCPTIIRYKGKEVFSLKRSDRNDFLGIDFDVFDSSGSRLATVRNGQFVGRRPTGFTIDGTADHYALTEDSTLRRVCEIKLRRKAAGDAELEVSAEMFMPDGQLLKLSPASSNFGGILVEGCTFQNLEAAIVID